MWEETELQMRYLGLLVLLFLCGTIICLAEPQQKWQSIESKTDPKIQRDEVYHLLDRVREQLSSEFEVDIDPSLATVSLVKASNSKVQVKASTGVLAVWGIHHYLKYYCGCHFSWDTIRITGIIPTSQ